MCGQRYDSRSRFLSFSTTSRFSSLSGGPSEACRREEASPFFPLGTSSPALGSVSFLLRSSMSLKRFMPVPLLSGLPSTPLNPRSLRACPYPAIELLQDRVAILVALLVVAYHPEFFCGE